MNLKCLRGEQAPNRKNMILFIINNYCYNIIIMLFIINNCFSFTWCVFNHIEDKILPKSELNLTKHSFGDVLICKNCIKIK